MRDSRRHARRGRRRRRRRGPVKLDALTALLIGRATWRMFRGRWPWQAGWRPYRFR
jgi:hypothetical protein